MMGKLSLRKNTNYTNTTIAHALFADDTSIVYISDKDIYNILNIYGEVTDKANFLFNWGEVLRSTGGNCGN